MYSLKSLRQVLRAGKDYTYITRLLGRLRDREDFVWVVNRTLATTYGEERVPGIIERFQDQLEKGFYKYIGLHYSIPVDNGKVVPLAIFLPARSQSGEFQMAPKPQAAIYPRGIEPQSNEESEFLDYLEKRKILAIEVEDEDLTSASLRVILEALKHDGVLTARTVSIEEKGG